MNAQAISIWSWMFLLSHLFRKGNQPFKSSGVALGKFPLVPIQGTIPPSYYASCGTITKAGKSFSVCFCANRHFFVHLVPRDSTIIFAYVWVTIQAIWIKKLQLCQQNVCPNSQLSCTTARSGCLWFGVNACAMCSNKCSTQFMLLFQHKKSQKEQPKGLAAPSQMEDQWLEFW